MDTRTIRLAAYLMSRGLPVGDLASGLEDRVLQALAGVATFGRPEVEACLAIGDASAAILLERLTARTESPAAAAPVPPAPAAAPPPAAAPAAASPSAATPVAAVPVAPPAAAPAAPAEPEPAEEVYFDPDLKAEIAGFIKGNAKFKTQLAGLPARLADNDQAYADMLVTYYRSREAKDLLGTRPSVLLGRFVDHWIHPELRPQARAEFSFELLFPPGEVP